jgi:hypothetical protein
VFFLSYFYCNNAPSISPDIFVAENSPKDALLETIMIFVSGWTYSITNALLKFFETIAQIHTWLQI